MRGGDAWMVEFNLGVDAWMLEFNLRGWMLGCLNFSDSNYNRGILVKINGIYSKNQIATEKHKTIGYNPRAPTIKEESLCCQKI